jgi:anti-anti-sigma factor
MASYSRNSAHLQPDIPGLHVEVAREQYVTTVYIDGDVDLATVGLLDAGVQICLQGPPLRVVVDLSKVHFFGAAGLTVLLRLREEAEYAATDLVLRAPSAAVRTLLDIVDVTRYFRIDPQPVPSAHGARMSPRGGRLRHSGVSLRPGQPR